MRTQTLRASVWPGCHTPSVSGEEYLLAIDDSGMQIIRPPTDGRAFMLGGIILPLSKLDSFRAAWRASTRNFSLIQTGQRPRVPGDVKAVDFIHNYALPNLSDERRSAPAFAVFGQFAEMFELLPLLLVVDKRSVGDDLLMRTSKGERTIKLTELLPFFLGMFGSFLSRIRSRGQVRMDRLKNATEESIFRAAWDMQIRNMPTVARELEFVESVDHPEVQAADVLLGLLRGQHEQDFGFPKAIGNLFRRAEQAGIPVVHLS